MIHFFLVREAVSLRRRVVQGCKLKILSSLRVFRTENQYFNRTFVVKGCEWILPLEGWFVGWGAGGEEKVGNTLEQLPFIFTIWRRAVCSFIDECLMHYPQNEKEIKTRKKQTNKQTNRKKEKVYLASLMSMIHIRCHSNVSNIQLTALAGKRRSLHSYGLWCKSKKNNSRCNTWSTLFFEQPPRLL